MTSAISDLPIRLAVDVVLRDVRYSNSMPDWFITKNVDYSARQTAIEKRIASYLDGSGSPQKAFAVLLPRKLPGSQAATWLQPSINDMMILQACVTSLAPKIDATFDRKRVYSYRYNTDPNSTSLTEDQCSAWGSFKSVVGKNTSSSGYILCLDLEQSFASINRKRFWDFLGQFSSSKIEVQTLQALLKGFAPSDTGIPLINNALFFLGNAYFSEVDKIIGTHTKAYVRWNDDYCLFGSTPTEAESLYKSVNRDLSKAGFKLNEVKTNIVAAQEYCMALSSTAAANDTDTDQDESKYEPVPQTPPSPDIMVTSLKSTVQRPEQYLNDGVGRAQLASLRKLRDTLSEPARQQFANDLAHSSDTLTAGARLLNTYMNSPEQVWRSVWLLYLMKDLHVNAISGAQTRAKVEQALQKARNSAAVPVVKLWAKSRTMTLSPAQIESLGDLPYEEVGRRCCGG